MLRRNLNIEVVSKVDHDYQTELIKHQASLMMLIDDNYETVAFLFELSIVSRLFGVEISLF